MKDPRCHWCRETTELVIGEFSHGHLKPHMATTDHLDDRLSPMRGRMPGPRTVLSCWQCNQDRSVISQSLERRLVVTTETERPKLASLFPIEKLKALGLN